MRRKRKTKPIDGETSKTNIEHTHTDRGAEIIIVIMDKQMKIQSAKNRSMNEQFLDFC